MEYELLNVKEASFFLKVKISTLYAWTHQKRIKFVKLGSKLLFRKVDLIKLIECNLN